MRQRLARDLGARQRRDLAFDLDRHRIEQGRIVAEQDHLRIRPVLGLRQQVGGHEHRVGAGVGDDQHFRRPRRHVDRRPVRALGCLPLGLVDPGIAGAEQLLATRHAGRAQAHRGDRLRPAELEDARVRRVGRGDQHRGIGAAVAARRRAQHDLAAAGELRRDRQHQRSRRQGRAAGRHVQPDRADRPQHALAAHARRGVQRVGPRHAGAVEGVDARGRLVDRRTQRLSYRRQGGGAFGGIDLERLQAHAVVMLGEHAQRDIAARGHVGHDLFHPCLDPRRQRPRRPRQQLRAGRVVHRGPFDALHASILSTGSTISPRAPARLSSSSRCQVTTPWHSACIASMSSPSIG